MDFFLEVFMLCCRSLYRGCFWVQSYEFDFVYIFCFVIGCYLINYVKKIFVLVLNDFNKILCSFMRLNIRQVIRDC